MLHFSSEKSQIIPLGIINKIYLKIIKENHRFILKMYNVSDVN